MNKVFLLGYLGKDIETRQTSSGILVAESSIATQEKKGGETQWHNLKWFGDGAQLAQRYLRKGSQILVEGKITYNRYETKSGETKYFTNIIVDRMKFLGGGKPQQQGYSEKNHERRPSGQNQGGPHQAASHQWEDMPNDDVPF